MKNVVIAFAIVVVLIAGCSLDAPLQTGSIEIQLPSRASTLAITGVDYQIARIRLTSGSTALPIDGLDFLDVTEDSVTISGLLPDTYSVQASFGSETSGGVLYSVVAYGASAPFSIAAGVTSRVTIGLNRQAVFTVTSTVGTEFVNVVTVGGVRYTLDRSGAIYADGVAMDLSALAGKDVISISRGAFFDSSTTTADELWINTDGGIFPYRGGRIITNFSSGMPSQVNLDIQSTFVYRVKGTNGGDASLIIGTQGTGLDSLMGTYVSYADSGDPSTWEWSGWSSLDESVGGLGDIRDALTGVGEVIYDMVFGDEYLIAATALQTFIITEDDMSGLIDYFDNLGDNSEIDLETVFGYLGVISLTGGADAGKTIKSVEVEGTNLYLGTNTRNDPHNGVLVAQINPTGEITADAVKIAETDGTNVKDIVYDPDMGKTVAFSATSLIVLADGAFVKKIPFYAGLPGRVADIDWDGSRLYVVGTEGVAYVPF